MSLSILWPDILFNKEKKSNQYLVTLAGNYNHFQVVFIVINTCGSLKRFAAQMH